MSDNTDTSSNEIDPMVRMLREAAGMIILRRSYGVVLGLVALLLLVFLIWRAVTTDEPLHLEVLPLVMGFAAYGAVMWHYDHQACAQFASWPGWRRWLYGATVPVMLLAFFGGLVLARSLSADGAMPWWPVLIAVGLPGTAAFHLAVEECRLHGLVFWPKRR